MYAFVLIHFGNKPKYLELEIYISKMIRDNSKYDIVYLYSINDTPQSFVDIMKNYCTKTISFDDKGITYEIQNFKSLYQHFNTLRTCDFLFAYQLTEYKKVCIIESDMIILKNIDDIFDLKTPSVLTYYDNSKILNNYKININTSKNLEECSKHSNINGGVMLLKPSLSKYKLCLKNIKKIVNNNCIYPNETLLLISNKTIYNLPYKYNGVQFNLQKFSDIFKIDMKNYLSILHMNAKEHKHIFLVTSVKMVKLNADSVFINFNNIILLFYYFIIFMQLLFQ
jgi:hypothetical protein